MKSVDRMSGSEEGSSSGTPDPDRNAAFWPEDDEEIEVDYMHIGSEDSGGKRGHSKARQGTCCGRKITESLGNVTVRGEK